MWPLPDTTHAQNQFITVVAERTEHLFTVYATMCHRYNVSLPSHIYLNYQNLAFGGFHVEMGSSYRAQDGLNHPDDSAYKELGLQTHIQKHPALTVWDVLVVV